MSDVCYLKTRIYPFDMMIFLFQTSLIIDQPDLSECSPRANPTLRSVEPVAVASLCVPNDSVNQGLDVLYQLYDKQTM